MGLFSMKESIIGATLKEDRKHGNESFPIAPYWMAYGPGEHVLNCHWHEEAEFLYVMEGATLFQIGTGYYPVNAGEAVFIHGGDIHAGYPLGNDGCKFFAVVFDMNLLRSGMNDIVQSDYILPLLEGRRSLPPLFNGDVPWQKAVLSSLNGIVQAFEKGKQGYELFVKAHLYLILSEIASGNHWMVRNPADRSDLHKIDRLKTVLSYIANCYNRKIRIKEMASMICMSEGHFCRFFKSLVRKTPIDYINSYRVEKAAQLLEHNDRKIIDIAMEVGFDNLSYFIKKFKEHMDCTPSEYRKSKSSGYLRP